MMRSTPVFKKCSCRGIFFSSITNPSTRFINSLVYAAVGVFGSIYAIHGGITVGKLSCFLSYANQYTKPFNEISGVVTELQNAIACAGRAFGIDRRAGRSGRNCGSTGMKWTEAYLCRMYVFPMIQREKTH